MSESRKCLVGPLLDVALWLTIPFGAGEESASSRRAAKANDAIDALRGERGASSSR